MGAQHDNSKKAATKGWELAHNPSRMRRLAEKKLVRAEEELIDKGKVVEMNEVNKVFYAQPVDRDHPYARFIVAKNEEEVVQILDKFIDKITFDRPFIKYYRWWLVKEEREIVEVDLSYSHIVSKH